MKKDWRCVIGFHDWAITDTEAVALPVDDLGYGEHKFYYNKICIRDGCQVGIFDADECRRELAIKQSKYEARQIEIARAKLKWKQLKPELL
jgi:hypothetical protein